MPSLSFASLAGLAGVAFGVGATWSQFRRARRVSTDGISLTTWYQFLLMGIFWTSYGVGVHSRIVIAGSVLVFPMQVAIVRRLEPWRHPRTIVRASVFIAVCCFLPTVLFGWSAGALGTGVAMVINRLPQIIELVRHPGDLGVSVASWSIGAISMLVWICYYAGEGLVAPLVATAAGMCGNVAIAVLAAWRHRQNAPDGCVPDRSRDEASVAPAT
jgi:hypothetical protein